VSQVVRPYRQGELDSLCGVYCVVNAVRLAARPHRQLGRTTSTALFAVLVRELDERHRLRKVVTDGMGTRLVARLLRQAQRWLQDEHGLRLEVRAPFRKKDAPGHCLEVLTAYLAQPGTAAVVATEEHWTVAQAVGSKRLHLFDSNRRVYFRLTVTHGAGGKGQVCPRLLLPGTFLLRATTTAHDHDLRQARG
jgi:hypothetical protein